MDVDSLITSVFKRPSIWDKRRKLYSNRTAVDTCWKEISEELQSEESLVRKKWKYLRDNFAVEYGKMLQSRSGNAANSFPRSKWHYLQQLMFLKDVVTPRTSSGSLNSSFNFERAETDHRDQVEHDFMLQDNTSEEISTEDSCVPFQEFKEEVEETQMLQPERQESQSICNKQMVENGTAPTASKRKRKFIEVEQGNTQCVHIEPRRVADEEDTDLMFFKTLLPHVRLIPQRMKLQFQSQIQLVVQEYAYSSQNS